MSWSGETAVRTLWQEARGEPIEGQRAVAHVLWNRLRTRRWGDTLACVCLAPWQFSGWNMHDPNRMAAAALDDLAPSLAPLRAILVEAEVGEDPTGGAIYYYAASMKAPPSWATDAHKPVVFCGQFGNQKFFREQMP